ncbi:hypothetical protein HPB51_005159 [Rhipicephalus microplus]|uniref:ADAM10 cysteine-rich domain-containing protein n=1 Tax=Rhipicephalus microplus TaxID=6941 RepID=A0A9J6DKW3_RHIMP|nr:hypothetical protein HPB51_005159 [Rhipicephalus microplus]
MTACNKNTQVCLSGECQGSVCEKYGLLECFRKAEGLSISEQCLLTCEAPGSKECEVACAFPIMASHCGAKLQPGSPCNDMRGYCDIFHKCRHVEPRGFLTRLQGFFLGGQSVDTLYEFVADYQEQMQTPSSPSSLWNDPSNVGRCEVPLRGGCPALPPNVTGRGLGLQDSVHRESAAEQDV